MLLMIFNISGFGQHPEDLTDREMLIQLIERFNQIEEAIKRIENNSNAIIGEIISFDKEIYKNSIEIGNLLEAYRGTVSRWNALLALFATFILGIFVWMWKKTYK